MSEKAEENKNDTTVNNLPVEENEAMKLFRTRVYYGGIVGGSIVGINHYMYAKELAAQEISQIPLGLKGYERGDELKKVYSKMGRTVAVGFATGTVKFGLFASIFGGIDYGMSSYFGTRGILNLATAGAITAALFGSFQGGWRGVKIAVPIITGCSIAYGLLEEGIFRTIKKLEQDGVEDIPTILKKKVAAKSKEDENENENDETTSNNNNNIETDNNSDDNLTSV